MIIKAQTKHPLRIVAICGCDASGKSGLVRALSAAIGARPFHHPKPPEGADPWEAACWYATVRARFIRESEGLWVTDRWIPSTNTRGIALGNQYLELFATAELFEHPLPLVTVLCWAPDDVLDSRIYARGEPVTEVDRRIRVAYQDQANRSRWPRVRTDGTRAETLALALDAVRPYLGMEGSDGVSLR